MFQLLNNRLVFQTLTLLATGLPLVTTSSARPLAEACHEATPVQLTGEHTLHSDGGDGLQYLNVTIPSTGILVIDVETEASRGDDPRLTLLGKGCAETEEGISTQNDFILVEQSLSHQMVAFRSPGTWSIRVASAVPGAMLGAYEVHLSFVAAKATEEDIDLGRGQEASRLRARRIEFSVDTPESRSEQAAVDPDPDAPLGWAEDEKVTVLSLVTFYSSPVPRSEQAAVDPDPDASFTFEQTSELGTGEKLAHLVLYPAGVVRQGREGRQGASGLGKGTGAQILQQLAALLWYPARR